LIGCRNPVKQFALCNRPDAAVAIPESLQDPGIAGAGFEPEVRFQRRDRDHASGRAVLAWDGERYAAAIRQHLRFRFDGFHSR
jgi:hypothetical protein